MKHFLGIVGLIGLLGSTALGQQSNHEDRLPPPPEGKQWKMVWQDEFDGETLDETKWERRQTGSGGTVGG